MGPRQNAFNHFSTFALNRPVWVWIEWSRRQHTDRWSRNCVSTYLSFSTLYNSTHPSFNQKCTTWRKRRLTWYEFQSRSKEPVWWSCLTSSKRTEQDSSDDELFLLSPSASVIPNPHSEARQLPLLLAGALTWWSKAEKTSSVNKNDWDVCYSRSHWCGQTAKPHEFRHVDPWNRHRKSLEDPGIVQCDTRNSHWTSTRLNDVETELASDC